MGRQVRRYLVARGHSLRADVLQVVSSLWHNFPGGFSHKPETAASIASTTTNRCRPIPPLCISPAVWRLSLRLTLRSAGVARGEILKYVGQSSASCFAQVRQQVFVRLGAC